MEKRVMERYHISLRAIVSFADAPTEELEIVDISGGGLFLRTDHPVEAGARVYMSLFVDNLPDKSIAEKIVGKIKGTVRRSSRSGMAVCFDQRYPFSWM